MLKPMFGHRPKAKRFDYQPRYYDPGKDKDDRERDMKFRRLRPRSKPNRSLIFLLLGLMLVLWLISAL